MTEKKDFKINVKPDYDMLHAWGIKGNNLAEVKDSCSELLKPKHTQKWYLTKEYYTLCGKKFWVYNKIANAALLTAGNDIRYPDFDKHDIPSLLKAGIEWYFNNKMNGQELNEKTWPEVEEYMKDLIDKDCLPWSFYKETYFAGVDKENYDETALISSFAEFILQEMTDIQIN